MAGLELVEAMELGALTSSSRDGGDKDGHWWRDLGLTGDEDSGGEGRGGDVCGSSAEGIERMGDTGVAVMTTTLQAGLSAEKMGLSWE